MERIGPLLPRQGIDQHHGKVHHHGFGAGQRPGLGDKDFTSGHDFRHLIGVAVKLHGMVKFVGKGRHFFVKIDVFTGDDNKFGNFIHLVQPANVVHHIPKAQSAAHNKNCPLFKRPLTGRLLIERAANGNTGDVDDITRHIIAFHQCLQVRRSHTETVKIMVHPELVDIKICNNPQKRHADFSLRLQQIRGACRKRMGENDRIGLQRIHQTLHAALESQGKHELGHLSEPAVLGIAV